ncbi:hypothetical protein ACQP1G_30830 [Nocardia sp. CA-107356]
MSERTMSQRTTQPRASGAVVSERQRVSHQHSASSRTAELSVSEVES